MVDRGSTSELFDWARECAWLRDGDRLSRRDKVLLVGSFFAQLLGDVVSSWLGLTG